MYKLYATSLILAATFSANAEGSSDPIADIIDASEAEPVIEEVVQVPSFKNKTAGEILSSGSTPEEMGLAIAIEADQRDFGFGDMEVDVQMDLENRHGEKSTREMRNKIFEMEDAKAGDKTMIIFDRPRDVKGTAFLTFSKVLEPDDQWLYLPALKRVKRISSNNKSGPFVGSEFAYEDISSQEVGKYDYKYLSSEPCPLPEYKDSQCMVVERYPNYEFSGYTKQVAWIDYEEFRPIRLDFYDRKNFHIKTLSHNGYKQYLGRYWRADSFKMVNLLNGKSTVLNWNNYKFRVGLEEDDFSKAKLKNAK